MVARTDPELRKLTDRFVCVRITQMGGVDLATFQFDPFLSWSLFFMHADKTIYGRYGQADPQTKRNKKDSNPNPTTEGLRASLERALLLHDRYAKKPQERAQLFASKTGPTPRWRFAEKTPAAKKYGRLRVVEPGEEKGCVHCHEVHRTALDSLYMEKEPIPDRMLWLYPSPDLLGLRMDRRQAARVRDVTPGSWAAEAGFQPGDDLIGMDRQLLTSVADMQWVLQNYADEGGAVPVDVKRGEESLTLTLELPKDWRRKGDFVWRYRMAGYASWLWTGVSFIDVDGQVRVQARSPGWWKKPNQDGKQTLQRGDVILDVDGRDDLDRSGLLAYLMREKKLGSKVKMTILRHGEKRKVSFKLPKKQPEIQGH